MSIETNIPVPTLRSGGKYTQVYENINQLQVGDSFAIDFVDYKTGQNSRSTIRQKSNILGIKTTTRKVVESGKIVLRTWRIE